MRHLVPRFPVSSSLVAQGALFAFSFMQRAACLVEFSRHNSREPFLCSLALALVISILFTNRGANCLPLPRPGPCFPCLRLVGESREPLNHPCGAVERELTET